MNRAYSTLQIKYFDDEQHVIEGIASTPSTDRQGDIVEAMGASFITPLPLLWQHDPRTPIGRVISATVSKTGIAIRAKIEHGLLPEIDRAWTLIKTGLVRGLSIGFRPLEMEPINPKHPWGPQRFVKWEWLELSAVTIPANQDASISLIKSLCAPAQSGIGVPAPVHSPAVASGSSVRPAMPSPISDQLTAATAALTTQSKRLEDLLALKGADGSLDEPQETELTTLLPQVETLTAQVKQLAALEAAQAAVAQPVRHKMPTGTTGDPTRIQMGDGPEQKLPPGIEFARAVMCKMDAFRRHINPIDVARERFRDFPRIHAYLKEDVPGASTLDSTWASSLVYAQNLTSEFVEFLRPQTIIGRIDGFTRVPFNVRVQGQTSGGTGYWVGELRAKPLTFWGTSAQTLRWAKVANIAVISQELARFSNPSAEAYVRDELARACRERLDIDFIDPDKAAVANVSPASITNGLTQLNSTATTTLQDVLTEMGSMMAPFASWNITPTHWIMPSSVAMKLSLMLTSLGNPAFPTLTMQGGTLLGLPVITSQYLISGTPSNNLVILLAAPEIFLADDGGFTIDVSDQASLEMNDAPTMTGGSLGSPTGATGSVVVSLWQINALGIKCERFINWSRRRGTTSPGVVWMDDVQWGGAIPS